MKSVPENIWVSKDLFYQLRWNTECLIFYPEIPSGKGQQLQQHRQMANALVAVQSLANAIGKCQFVADKINWGIRIDIYTLPCVKKAEHWRIDAFKLWCGRRFSRVPWTTRRSNQSILKEIRPEFSLEGLMLKLKLQYFGHLMQKTDSFEKTLMLGKIKGGRRRGWQRMRCFDGITDSMDMSLGKLRELVGQGGLVCCISWGCKESDMTEWLNWTELMCKLDS